MQYLGIDFETYYCTKSKYSLKNMTTEEYIRDPRFQVTMVAIKPDGAAAYWLTAEQFEAFVRATDWSQVIMICHNGHFDGFILGHHYGVQPAMYLDTLPMACVIDGPKAGLSLEKLCERHGVPAKGDYLRYVDGKRSEDFTAIDWDKCGEYACGDIISTCMLAFRWVPIIPQFMLRLQSIKIKMFTEPYLVGNSALLGQSVLDERKRKLELMTRVGLVCPICPPDAPVVTCKRCLGTGVSKERLSSNDKFATLLAEFGAEAPTKNSPAAAKKGEFKEIFAFAKTDPGMQALLEDEVDIIRWLAEARLGVKSTIVETRAKRLYDCSLRGPMPVYLKPNGAHTHRSSSGGSTNYQNMTSVSSTAPERLVLKRSIEAPPGCMIVAADASQIQARLTVWFFGQQDIVDQFARGEDVYSLFASEVYNRTVDRKKVEADYVAGQVGKISVLGFGFGQGWFKASINFLKGHLGAKPIQFTMADMTTMGIDASRFLNNPHYVTQVAEMPSRLPMDQRLVHCAVTWGIVNKWRNVNNMIAPKNSNHMVGWNIMEAAIDAMIAGTDYRFGPNGIIGTEKDALILPSGMRIHYKDIRRNAEGEATYWTGRERAHIYGGAATNNVIQGLEQEHIGHCILEIDALGYKVALEGYDSIVCVVPTECAQQCLSDMKRVMATNMAWAQGLPLAVDGGCGFNYLEAK